MSRFIYVNGAYKPYEDAMLHVEDRATLFADSVYEVIEVKAGCQVDGDAHLARLKISLAELQLSPHFNLNSIPVIIRETIRRNRVRNGFVYLQISRGRARRDFIFPDPEVTPTTLVVFARSKNPAILDRNAATGISVITMPDIRWKRPDIKSTALIASVLARQTAKDNRAQEAWFYDQDNFITEGAASNAWIITDKDALITHPATRAILKGITRDGVMRAAREVNLTFQERKFSIDEAANAREAFISAATNLVMPVTHIDGAAIGNGQPGPIAQKLRSIFHEFAQLTS